MNTPQAAELVLVIFAKMNKDERSALRALLKSVQPKMDMNYPGGLPEAAPKSNLILPK